MRVRFAVRACFRTPRQASGENSVSPDAQRAQCACVHPNNLRRFDDAAEAASRDHRSGHLDFVRSDFWWIGRGILHTLDDNRLPVPGHRLGSDGNKDEGPPMRGRKPCRASLQYREENAVKPSVVRYALFALVAGISVLTGPAEAQTQAPAWPDKPITFIVPFAAGGGTDAFARPLAAQLDAQLGKRVLIENRAGAGGTVGASARRRRGASSRSPRRASRRPG